MFGYLPLLRDIFRDSLGYMGKSFQLEYIDSFDISYHCEAKEKGSKPTKTLGLGSSPRPSRTLSSFSDGRALLVR